MLVDVRRHGPTYPTNPSLATVREGCFKRLELFHGSKVLAKLFTKVI